VLDLTGKGINITQLTSSNKFFDMTGNGQQNLTAWAGAGNGVLFFDPTGTGQLTQANQIIFTDWDPSATSDMQALLDVFDTNHDGKLDSGDTNFADFYVMETNADGTETPHSLASLGITSINLNASNSPFANKINAPRLAGRPLLPSLANRHLCSLTMKTAVTDFTGMAPRSALCPPTA
jgi:hypothetical protein